MRVPVIRSVGLSKCYGGFSALKDLDLEVAQGEWSAFSAPTGRERPQQSAFCLLGLNGRDVSSGPVGEGGETVAGEVGVSALASCHGQDQ